MAKAELERYKSTKMLDMYFEDTAGQFMHNSPLKWWSVHAAEFPNIAMFARRILPVQATSASVERLFPTAGNFINKKRAWLTDSMAGDLIMLHDSWQTLETPEPAKFVKVTSKE
jgi:hypothetical protein